MRYTNYELPSIYLKAVLYDLLYDFLYDPLVVNLEVQHAP